MISGLLILSLILLACTVFLAGATVWLMARAMLIPPRMEDGKAVYLLKRLSPTDIGLAYEAMSFNVRDEATGEQIRIESWWIAARTTSSRTVILLHGYADAKVGSIAWAPLWIELGWNVLAVDLRAHGQSGGRFFTAGYFERFDLIQVIDELRLRRPRQTEKIALMGISAGAAVAAATAAQLAQQGRDELAAVVLDSPFADYLNASRAHADLVGLPVFLVKPALWWAGRLSGARFVEVRPLDTVRQISAPLLLIQSRSDPFITSQEQSTLTDACHHRPAGAGKTVTWQVDAEHVLGLSTAPQEYAETLRNFLASVK